MRIAKWIFGVCLTAVFVFGGKVDVRAAYVFSEDGCWEYEEYRNGDIAVVGYHGTEESVEIPADIDGKHVDQVYARLWSGEKSAVRHLVLPEGITRIWCEHNYYLAGPNSLESISLPSTLENIGEGAFANSNLKEIELPDGVTSVEDYVFKECASLERVKLPDSLESIGRAAFDECVSLKEIELPDGVKSVGPYAFYGCVSLAGVNFPEGLAGIGEFAFSHAGLREAVLPGSLKEIEASTFAYCAELRSVELPDGLESIGLAAFCMCESLESVTVPDSVGHIEGREAFLGDEPVPGNRRYILIRTNPDSYARRYADENGIGFSCIEHAGARSHPAVPATCTRDGRTAGSRCEECGSAVTGMELIPKKGHRYAEKKIEATCRRPGMRYMYCTTCGTIDRRTMRATGYGAHNYLAVRNKLTGKDVYTCRVCGHVKNPEDAEVKKNQVVEDGEGGASYKVVKAGKRGGTVEFREADPGASSVEVPDSIKIGGATYRVTSVAKDAFRGNKKLKKVTIGRNVTRIQAGAFGGCRNLKTITVRSKGIKTVGKNAFKGIQARAKIKVPASKYGKYKKLFRKKGQKSTVKIIKS